MSQSNTLAVRAPITARCATRTLALTTTEATVDLPAGGYELVLDGSTAMAVIGHGVTTTGKPDATETEGISVIPSLGSAEHAFDATTTLRARVLSGTATLCIVRKVEG
jgi:hypothetical protein